jgi:hypothetical protein
LSSVTIQENNTQETVSLVFHATHTPEPKTTTRFVPQTSALSGRRSTEMELAISAHHTLAFQPTEDLVRSQFAQVIKSLMSAVSAENVLDSIDLSFQKEKLVFRMTALQTSD